jgi:peroxiredoxin
MKQFICILCFAIVSNLLFAQQKLPPTKPAKMTAAQVEKIVALAKSMETKLIGKPLPTILAATNDSINYDTNKVINKLVFIHFWDATNPMCIAQMDGMNRLYQKLKDSTNIEFVTITYETDEAIATCKNMYNMPYTILKMSKANCLAFKQENGYPTNIITDRKGVIRYMKCGGDISTDFATQFVIGKMYPRLLEIYNSK